MPRERKCLKQNVPVFRSFNSFGLCCCEWKRLSLRFAGLSSPPKKGFQKPDRIDVVKGVDISDDSDDVGCLMMPWGLTS